MRFCLVLAAFFPLASAAQTLCGAPGAMSPRDAEQRFAALAVDGPDVPRDPYETTAEWQARRDRQRAATRRVALAALGPERTIRVGVPATPRYDADAETLWLTTSQPLPSIPYEVNRTYAVDGLVEWETAPTVALWGTPEPAQVLQFDRGLGVSLTRVRARTLDAAHAPACLFFVYRVIDRDGPVVRYERVEAAVVSGRESHVWSWSVRDDETLSPPPPSPPPPPAAAPPPPPEAFYEEDAIYDVVEQEPVLIGGLEGLARAIVYPELARRANIEGTVYVQFVVDERGNVTHPVVTRSPNASLSDEALRVVNAARFQPGQQRGQPVKVRYMLPIRFQLR